MKMILFKNKKTKITVILTAIILLVVATMTAVFGMSNYYKVDFSTGIVTADVLNVRSGIGLTYSVVTKVKKNSYIRVLAGVGNWYIVQVEGDYVGAVSKQYVKPVYSNSSGSTSSGSSGSSGSTSTSSLTSDELETFNLVNAERTKNGLSALKIDSEVQRVARIKAQDMVNNNYFSHTSPTYGSPFDMLNSFKISYNTAGENIAGNSSNSAAVGAWMNSSGHRANILNGSFNYTGVGVVNGSKYGRIYVQIFIGK